MNKREAKIHIYRETAGLMRVAKKTGHFMLSFGDDNGKDKSTIERAIDDLVERLEKKANKMEATNEREKEYEQLIRTRT